MYRQSTKYLKQNRDENTCKTKGRVRLSWLLAKVVFAALFLTKGTTMTEAGIALSEVVEKGAKDGVVRRLLGRPVEPLKDF